MNAFFVSVAVAAEIPFCLIALTVRLKDCLPRLIICLAPPAFEAMLDAPGPAIPPHATPTAVSATTSVKSNLPVATCEATLLVAEIAPLNAIDVTSPAPDAAKMPLAIPAAVFINTSVRLPPDITVEIPPISPPTTAPAIKCQNSPPSSTRVIGLPSQ